MPRMNDLMMCNPRLLSPSDSTRYDGPAWLAVVRLENALDQLEQAALRDWEDPEACEHSLSSLVDEAIKALAYLESRDPGYDLAPLKRRLRAARRTARTTFARVLRR